MATSHYGETLNALRGYKELTLAPAKSTRKVLILGRGVYPPRGAEEIRYDADRDELFRVCGARQAIELLCTSLGKCLSRPVSKQSGRSDAARPGRTPQ